MDQWLDSLTNSTHVPAYSTPTTPRTSSCTPECSTTPCKHDPPPLLPSLPLPLPSFLFSLPYLTLSSLALSSSFLFSLPYLLSSLLPPPLHPSSPPSIYSPPPSFFSPSLTSSAPPSSLLPLNLLIKSVSNQFSGAPYISHTLHSLIPYIPFPFPFPFRRSTEFSLALM